MVLVSNRVWFAVAAGTVLWLATAGQAVASPDRADPQEVRSPPAPQPRRIDDNVYALGAVRLDKERRTVSFPASLNQRTGVVEYAVVTTRGKTHESVFRTEAQPQHIHLAMLLLGASPANTNGFPADLSLPLPGERVALEVAWQDGGREVRRALEEFVVTTNNHRTLAEGPWVYNGSYMAETTFVAQRDGSIVSVHIDPDALVNNPRPGRENDDLHFVNTQVLPPDGVPVQITLRLPPRATNAPVPANPADAAALPPREPQ